MVQWERIKRKCDERIDEFEKLGVKAEPGPGLGCIQFSATESESLLRMIRRLIRVNQKLLSRTVAKVDK